jgi:hypothetical protein
MSLALPSSKVDHLVAIKKLVGSVDEAKEPNQINNFPENSDWRLMFHGRRRRMKPSMLNCT